MSAVEAPSTPPPPPPPEPRGRSKTLVLVLVAVLIVAALAGVTYYLLSTGTPPVTPPAVTLDRVTITGSNSMDQSAVLTLSATAIDTTGRGQTGNATWTWTANPASAVQLLVTTTASTRQIRAIQSGSVTITANASWNNSARQSTHSITIAALTFELTPSDLFPLVSEPFTLALRVLRGTTVASSYSGTVTFTSTDTGATLPADYTFSLTDGGLHSFDNVNVSRSGSVTFTTRDTVAAISGNAAVNGNRVPDVSFTLTPNAANPLEMTADGRTSSDPDGDVISFEWDFGDGESATTSLETHTYAVAGVYTVRLTVTDSHAASNFSEEDYDARAPPTASFNIVSVTPSGPGLRVAVDASASSDLDGTIVNYNWTWGDGNYSDTAAPATSHDYDAFWLDQTVTIILEVTDDDGLTDTASRTLQLTVLPLPPVASFRVTDIDDVTRTVSVDGSASSDPNANIMWYNWTWDDGSFTNVTIPTASHQYADDGTFTITLTVIDSTNLKDSTTRDVTVQQPDVAPVASFTVDRSYLHVDVDASGSSDLNGNIATYEWDFENDGMVDDTGVTASFDYAGPGMYTISLIVTDTTALQGSTTRIVSAALSTLDYRYYDFFNVPYGEWWDYRYANYGDLPIRADCFNETSIATGVCVPNTGNSVPDFSEYPYTNWYPLPGQIRPGNPTNNPLVYAPYRFDVLGANVAGYNLSEPVFLPVFNYGAPPGTVLDFTWKMQYLDTATGSALTAAGCPGVQPRFNDGFEVRSQIWLTMDLQQSKRIFGVPIGSNAAQAQTWWNQNTNNACGTQGALENSVQSWFEALGGPAGTAGKYDIVNSFEYQYTPFYTNITAIVETGGTTHVYLEHAAWGTEVLLARMFYWGNASYLNNYLDSTKARGWWGMELGWFEDLTFQGGLARLTFNFTLSSVMQYHYQQLTFPGTDGLWNRQGDIPYWTWGPILTDYTNDYSPKHTASELDRYPSPFYGYIHTTPGSARYSQNLSYDYVPIRWDLATGQTWHFEYPTGDVVFYDPNNTPLGADPRYGAFIELQRTMSYDSTKPVDYGIWDAANFTWDVFGPAATGGPVGDAGPNGTPGNADDRYALEPWGALALVAGPAAGTALVSPAFVDSPSGSQSEAIAGPLSVLAAEVGVLRPPRVATARSSRE